MYNLLNISEDVKALSLPGTYHEKLVEFGSSFRKFTRLKSLDVSRNTITCLKVEPFKYIFLFVVSWPTDKQILKNLNFYKFYFCIKLPSNMLFPDMTKKIPDLKIVSYSIFAKDNLTQLINKIQNKENSKIYLV